MTTIAAGSAVYDLTGRLYDLMDKETTFARRFTSDSSNTNSVPLSTSYKVMARTASQLSGLAASTAELNLMDGAVGYGLGYVTAAGRMVAATKRDVTGSTLITMAALGMAGQPGGVAPLILCQLAAATGPGAKYSFSRASYVCGSKSAGAGTIAIHVYMPTASTTNTPVASDTAVTLDLWVFGI